MKCSLLCVMAVAAIPIWARPAGAHALHVEARMRGERVTIEVFFSDDSPAAGARIVVVNQAGEQIAAGQTGDDGVWILARPAPGSYEVTADAGGGHRSRVVMTIPSELVLRAHTSRPEETEVLVTGGRSRAEIRRFPWLRVWVGLGAIAGLGGVIWLATRTAAGSKSSVSDHSGTGLE